MGGIFLDLENLFNCFVGVDATHFDNLVVEELKPSETWVNYILLSRNQSMKVKL